MKYARADRNLLCDLALDHGPDAPTLCAGWTVSDLVAHLILREDSIPAGLGMVIPALAAGTARRMADLTAATPFPSLVERLRHGPGRWSAFRVLRLDEAANLVEYFVHVEDIRRAGSEPMPPRHLPPALQDVLWQRLRRMGRLLFRKAKCAVVLERRGIGDTLRFGQASSIVHLVGDPAELLLFAFGRCPVAQVDVFGESQTVAALESGLGL